MRLTTSAGAVEYESRSADVHIQDTKQQSGELHYIKPPRETLQSEDRNIPITVAHPVL